MTFSDFYLQNAAYIRKLSRYTSRYFRVLFFRFTCKFLSLNETNILIEVRYLCTNIYNKVLINNSLKIKINSKEITKIFMNAICLGKVKMLYSCWIELIISICLIIAMELGAI